MIDPEQPLETPRLLLEPLVPSHAAALYAALQAPELYTFIPQDPLASLDALAARYTAIATRHSPDGRERWLNWAARSRATGASIGTFEATVHADRTARLAYMVFPPFQRQGYAAEACARACSPCFSPTTR